MCAHLCLSSALPRPLLSAVACVAFPCPFLSAVGVWPDLPIIRVDKRVWQLSKVEAKAQSQDLEATVGNVRVCVCV